MLLKHCCFSVKKCEIPHYADTSVFNSIISTWWSIVNVKTPLKGKQLVNVFEEPVSFETYVK